MKFLVIKRSRGGVIFYLAQLSGQNTWIAVRNGATEFDQATAKSVAAAENAEVIPA